ncbi:TetR/AcrR family transcriptional regulator [Acrocarpospora macrocephala]|uniref:TetR family transcriptional regulator n=1 Tax=Acrocarpospora macrocephala TaxID=150177 RepID=A0A5M3WD29_9ACTN|nr:TetR/AcrR family transcriptional regulator [Acrocarpospora macrocephala]GES06975.1 TetR family transcriptional regulator [Acrocarpospora macrocephala]
MTLSRAERRQRTEQRILQSARMLFAERGFERTTIRAVAAAAGVDPALVMQHFGSKDDLFRRAVQAAPPPERPGGPEELVEYLLDTLGLKMGGLSQQSLAMMRSMLTHPEAAESARAALGAQIERLASAIDAPDARLRAALLTTIMLGVAVGHQLLDIEDLHDVPQQELARVLRPVLHSLLSS